jgi:opacity protein-like surface antigen
VAFLTLGAAAEVGDFTLSAVYGQSRAGTSTDGRFATAGIDYELTDELSVSLGYRYLEDEGAASNSLGLQLTLEFGVR